MSYRPTRYKPPSEYLKKLPKYERNILSTQMRSCPVCRQRRKHYLVFDKWVCGKCGRWDAVSSSVRTTQIEGSIAKAYRFVANTTTTTAQDIGAVYSMWYGHTHGSNWNQEDFVDALWSMREKHYPKFDLFQGYGMMPIRFDRQSRGGDKRSYHHILIQNDLVKELEKKKDTS